MITPKTLYLREVSKIQAEGAVTMLLDAKVYFCCLPHNGSFSIGVDPKDTEILDSIIKTLTARF